LAQNHTVPSDSSAFSLAAGFSRLNAIWVIDNLLVHGTNKLKEKQRRSIEGAFDTAAAKITYLGNSASAGRCDR
jgi:hypothetical protein